MEVMSEGGEWDKDKDNVEPGGEEEIAKRVAPAGFTLRLDERDHPLTKRAVLLSPTPVLTVGQERRAL